MIPLHVPSAVTVGRGRVRGGQRTHQSPAGADANEADNPRNTPFFMVVGVLRGGVKKWKFDLNRTSL